MNASQIIPLALTRMGAFLALDELPPAVLDRPCAPAFAGAGGIVLRITVKTGKDIRQFSAVQGEDEVLLHPNFRMLVTSEPAWDAALGALAIDLCEKSEDDSFVY